MQQRTVKTQKALHLTAGIVLLALASTMLYLPASAALHNIPKAEDPLQKTVLADNHNHDDSAEHNDEAQLNISERMLRLNQISTETAGSRTLVQKIHLYGVISTVPELQASVKAPYPAVLAKVLVKQGDIVSKGQLLANLTNLSTLKSYQLHAPLAGVITQRYLNDGELIREETLLDIADFSKVYVELSAFPSDVAALKTGMPVSVFSLHQAKVANGAVEYISEQMTDGHIARARARIGNEDGYWRPGMHVKAEIHTAELKVAVAVKKSALQRVENQPVVFVQDGDSFEVHRLTLGREDDDYIEVLSGLDAGSEYVSANSFILKADLLKSGASHQH